MLGSGWYHVDIVFRELPAHPQLKNDPLAKQMPHNQLYLYRMRELHLAHSVLYISNVYVIDNLYSRLKLATGGVSGAILGILGEGGQKAAAAFRHWRTLEDSDDISRRTMKYAGPIQVVKEDPVAHKSLPTFVWKTPEMDAAEYRNSVSWRTKYTPEMFERILVHDHTLMLRAAIEKQQHIIRSLANLLSEQTVISHLHKLLKSHKVPNKTRIQICAKVVALKCHWTSQIPANWLSEPVKATSESQHPTCVIEEEHTGSSSSNHNSNSSNNNSKGRRLFCVRIAKAVAAVGVTVASMMAGRHGG